MSSNSRPQANKASGTSSTRSRRAKRFQEWESIKGEVERLYIEEDESLQVTMQEVEEKFGFTSRPRKWKMKLKEWNFEKNLKKSQMDVLVAKAAKRARDEDKDTVFYHGKTEISSRKVQNFKKRRLADIATVNLDLDLADAETPPNVTYSTPEPEISAAASPLATKHEEGTIVPSSKGFVESAFSTTDQSFGTEISAGPGRIDSLIRGFEDDYPILTASANLHIHDVLSQVRGYKAEVSDQALADCAAELVDLAGSSAVNGRVSVALTAYVVVILLCSRRKHVDNQLLFTYTTSFLALQEREIFLPVSRHLVMLSYQKLLALLKTTYRAEELEWSIYGRMAMTVTRLFRDNAELRLNYSSLPQLRQHYEFKSKLIKGILDVIQQISGFLLREYGARECDPRPLSLSSASEARIFHEFMDLDFGWGGDHHMLQDTFQKAKQDILFQLLDWVVIQHNIRFSRTANQRSLWGKLLLKNHQLFTTFLSMRKMWLSDFAFEYIYVYFDIVLPPPEISIFWKLQNALRCAGASEDLMRLDRGALERSLTRLVGRMGNKVQEWLRGDIGILNTEENNPESLESYRRSPLALMDIDISTANNMDLGQDEMIGEDAPGHQESLSVMEVDESEPDEGLSVVTDLRSSRYGITYTESGMTGISFNYEALFH